MGTDQLKLTTNSNLPAVNTNKGKAGKNSTSGVASQKAKLEPTQDSLAVPTFSPPSPSGQGALAQALKSPIKKPALKKKKEPDCDEDLRRVDKVARQYIADAYGVHIRPALHDETVMQACKEWGEPNQFIDKYHPLLKHVYAKDHKGKPRNPEIKSRADNAAEKKVSPGLPTLTEKAAAASQNANASTQDHVALITQFHEVAKHVLAHGKRVVARGNPGEPCDKRFLPTTNKVNTDGKLEGLVATPFANKANTKEKRLGTLYPAEYKPSEIR